MSTLAASLALVNAENKTQQATGKPANTYSQPVTRLEVFAVSPAELALERLFQKGKSDRLAGFPCDSANGAYLNGWYSPTTDYYYITKWAAYLL